MGNAVNLIYKLNGNGVEDGIDVFELAPVLLSFGKLVKESHKVIYPNHNDIAINIKPFQKGSFEIELSLYGKTVLDQVLGFIKSSRVQDIKQLLEWIGLVSGGSLGLIKVILFLKGKCKSVEKLEDGNYKYTSEEGLSITVNGNVHLLFQNPIVQQTIYDSLAKPLDLECVENLESYIKGEKEKTKVSYDKKIIEPLRNYSISEPPDTEDNKPIENTRRLWLHPKRGSFEGEKKSWSFRLPGYDNIITANVMDEEFLEQIRSGNIRLAQSDRLLVEIIEKQHFKNGVPVKVTNDVVKVLEYIQGQRHEQEKIDV